MNREQTLYDLIPFKLIEPSFMAQDMIYLDKCFMCTAKNMVSAVVG